ncbi:hypothetical protein Dsin_017468 [Dipteronia sinensis]|uniref:Uncharacterized protein n=1 Tax=Dipteronia sinensis TaxID=43782 RepID=A0AAE0AGE7_9ROSI|nr:hypothetical protein Dsin_017468 [Dipteronia sinensis]
MKPTSLVLSFLIFALVTEALIVTADAEPDPVLDISGKKLQAGTDYYILPVERGRGGGLTLASTGNETCPLDVIQEQHEVENGLLLIVRPVNIKKGDVRLSTDLNIKFSTVSTCVQSTVWKLDNFDESLGQWFGTTGGVEGNPGRETVGNWFKIEKFDGDYKLLFCPTVCDICRVVCRDIGIYIDQAGAFSRSQPLIAPSYGVYVAGEVEFTSCPFVGDDTTKSLTNEQNVNNQRRGWSGASETQQRGRFGREGRLGEVGDVEQTVSYRTEAVTANEARRRQWRRWLGRDSGDEDFRKPIAPLHNSSSWRCVASTGIEEMPSNGAQAPPQGRGANGILPFSFSLAHLTCFSTILRPLNSEFESFFGLQTVTLSRSWMSMKL